jgi:hypothetical protein
MRRARRAPASLFDELTRLLLDGAGASCRDLLRGAGRRVLLVGAALAALIAAVIFLLVAGVEGLRAASVPASAAYLGMGILGLIAAYGLVKLRA